MQTTSMVPEEGHSDQFNRDELLSVRERTWKALNLISERMAVGMTEPEAREVAKEIILQELGAEKQWHPPKIRFGVNTTCAFSDRSEEGTQLEEEDLYFVDIGPVWNGYEGDAGRTFAMSGAGEEKRRCVADSERVFEEVRSAWKDEGLTGEALYRFAVQSAEDKGWKFSMGNDGHRLGEFPHQVYCRDGLAEQSGYTPAAYAWVLEIQLLDPAGRFGAFYEDLMF